MPRSTPRPTQTASRTPIEPAIKSDLNDIRELFSFQLQRLAGLSTRIAALTIRPKFGITPREWRAMAVLGYLDEAPLQELARHTGILKSQLSRTVTGLIERGLIQRSANPEDGRSVLLRLSPKGTKMTNQILAESQVRNDRMLVSLAPHERAFLSELIGRAFKSSLGYYNEIKKSSPPLDPHDLDDD